MDNTKVINKSLVDELISKAHNSERKRANYNLHPQLDDKVQRFFNAMSMGTYVQPHRHQGDDKWELFIILRGSLMALIFDGEGRIRERHILKAGSDAAIEIAANTWHTIVPLENDTLMFESKRGPYSPTHAKDFAQWAPKEGDADVEAFIEWFNNADIGSPPPVRQDV